MFPKFKQNLERGNMFDLHVHTYRLKKYFVPGQLYLPLVNWEGLIRDCHFRIV